jgi:hypothetical protein
MRFSKVGRGSRRVFVVLQTVLGILHANAQPNFTGSKSRRIHSIEMGLLTILKKIKQKEKEIRLLIL